MTKRGSYKVKRGIGESSGLSRVKIWASEDLEKGGSPALGAMAKEETKKTRRSFEGAEKVYAWIPGKKKPV